MDVPRARSAAAVAASEAGCPLVIFTGFAGRESRTVGPTEPDTTVNKGVTMTSEVTTDWSLPNSMEA